MQSGSEAVVVVGPDAVGTQSSYPVLLLRFWLARARLEARAAVRAVRPYDSADDRRLAALVVALAMAGLLLVGSVLTGSSAASTVLTIAVGFFATLVASLYLLFGPNDDDCQAELAAVAAVLPEAKQTWQAERVKARAARAARRAERAAARQARRAERQAARAVRKGGRAATRTAKSAVPAPSDAVPVLPEFPRLGNHQPFETPSRVDRPADADEELVELVPASGPPPAPWLDGDGTYPVSVVGEVHLPRILEAALGELPGVGEDRVVAAILRPVDGPQDAQAVAVEVKGRRVGHLSRSDAQAFYDGPGRNGSVVRCRAAIHGAWDHGRVRHSVRLDVQL